MTAPGARSFVLLGNPVAHSVSPAIYAAAFAALKIHATYVACRVNAEQVPGVVRQYADAGGGNVTLPHKQRVAALLDRSTDQVAATGACNCFWSDSQGSLWGDNTDVGGFLASLQHRLSLTVAGARVLVLGAGGAARAVLHACVTEGARSVDVLNRTPEHAVELVRRVSAAGVPVRTRSRPGDLAPGYDLVVNATRLGLRESDPTPLDLERVRAGAVLDLVYGPEGTRWTRHADNLGIVAADGLDMLVRQAALSLQRWFPDAEPPISVMLAAAERAIQGPGPPPEPSGPHA